MSTMKLPLRILAMLSLAVLVSACSDPFKMKASYPTVPFVYSLYGLSGSGPANAPAALDIATGSAVKVDGNFAFDIAFDVDGTGRIRVIPQRLVGTPVSGSRSIGLQRLAGSYDAVLAAPTSGWKIDSLVTVLPGEVVGLRMTASSCLYQLSSEMYAKIVIDSVKAGGLMFGRGVFNPNCGFKSFAAGVPEN